MKKFYPAVFHYEDGKYSVEFPTLKGCLTEGDNFNEACIMAEDALGEWIDSQEDIGNDIPTPLEIDEIFKQYPNEKVIAIGYDEVEWKEKHSNKAVRKTVSIPEWLDKKATKEGLSLSKILQSALKRELNL